MRFRVVLLEEDRVAFRCVARPVGAAVEPVHELAGIVPDGKGEDHATTESLAHGRQAAEFGSTGRFGETCLRSDDVARGISAGEDLAVLDVFAGDRCQSTGWSAIIGVELRDNREWL